MQLTIARPLGWQRLAQIVALAIVAGIGVSQVIFAIADWRLDDWAIYRAAADRIVAGEPLYSGGDALHAYRYAPWLAYAAIPFAGPIWSALMLLGSALALVPLSRRWREPEALLLLALFAPILFYLSSSGNIQGPMLSALVYGLPRRWAWMAVGLAASLKIVPILFAIVLIGQRRYWQAAGAVALTAILWAPVLWMSWSESTVSAGAASAPGWPFLGILALGAATLLARSRYATLAAGSAAIAALPRFFLYDVTLLLPAVSPIGASRQRSHSVSSRFERIVRGLRLPLIRRHDLRHTHATLAPAAGLHPKVVQETRCRACRPMQPTRSPRSST